MDKDDEAARPGERADGRRTAPGGTRGEDITPAAIGREPAPNPCYAAAIEHIEAGRPVMPVNPTSKKPLLDRWGPLQERVPTAEEVGSWFSRWPTAGLALITGKLSGVVVVDLDLYKVAEGDRAAFLAAADARWGKSPLTAQTQRGGEHRYFACPTGAEVASRNGQEIQFVDVKAEGGYVLLPPTPEYEWTRVEADFDELPEYVPAARAEEFDTHLRERPKLTEGVAEGSRNATATSLAGRLLAEGKSAEETLVWLRGWNTENRPPLDDAELRCTVESVVKTDQRNYPEGHDSVKILDAAPASLSRPLCLVGGHAYAATWLHMEHLIRTSEDKAGNTVTHDPPRKETRQNLVVVRDDGKLFTNERLPDSEPLAALKLTVHLEEIPQPSALWSGKGVKRYMKGERPAPADVFKRVVAVVDRFMDFDRSLAPQRTMAEMVACYILATYILEALNVAGYLWPRGEPGSGKTHLLRTACSLAYLGTVILAGGSFASLRDLADYGATLAFDDAEKLDAKTADPDKRALLLAGNRRGVTVPMKEPDGPKKWKTRHVNTYCHRMFSATRLPDSVLGSRSIVIPLVRSAHPDKATVDPLDPEAWPLDRRTLVDDLWALGLTHLRQLKKYDATAAARAHLKGRVLDPWRGILAVALWLQETYGEAGLFERMEALSRAYQKERSELEVSDATRLLIRALLAIFARSDASRLEVTPKELAQEVNRLARDEDLADEGESWTDHQRVGKLLSRLRLGEAGRTGQRRYRTIPRAGLTARALAYGFPSPGYEPSQESQPSQASHGTSEEPLRGDGCDGNDGCDGSQEGDSTHGNGTGDAAPRFDGPPPEDDDFIPSDRPEVEAEAAEQGFGI